MSGKRFYWPRYTHVLVTSSGKSSFRHVSRWRLLRAAFAPARKDVFL